MSDFNFNCPYCKQKFKCDESDIGQAAECPSCHSEITIERPKEAMVIREPDAPETVDASLVLCPYCQESVSPMAIICPHCHQSISRCPQCGARGTMDYCELTSSSLKAIGGATVGAIAGGLCFGGVLGAVLGALGGISSVSSPRPKGYLKCRICGNVIGKNEDSAQPQPEPKDKPETPQTKTEELKNFGKNAAGCLAVIPESVKENRKRRM